MTIPRTTSIASTRVPAAAGRSIGGPWTVRVAWPSIIVLEVLLTAQPALVAGELCRAQ
jgi:hypothetical protein